MKANTKYEKNDKGVFDYKLTDHSIGNISGFRNFDGTQKDIVCLGAASTMGRYSHNPFPMLIEDNTKYSVANFGWGGVSDHQYNNPEFINYINLSKLCIYQINSGRSAKNFNKTFNLGDTPITERPLKLSSLYRNNFSEFKEMFDKYKEEYLKNAKSLIQQIKVPIIFIYISKSNLYDLDEHKMQTERPMELVWNFPQFVTMQMVLELANENKLECFKQLESQRLPKPISNIQSLQFNNIFQTDDYYPDQETHYDVADFCIKTINKII